MAKNIPEHTDHQGMKAKVIAGDVLGVKGPIVARTPTYFIDFEFSKKGAIYYHEIPAEWNSMIVCYKGSLKVQDKKTISSVNVAQFK